MIDFLKTTFRPGIKENTARAVAARCVTIARDSKSNAIILWPSSSVKLNIGKEIAGLEIMTLFPKKI